VTNKDEREQQLKNRRQQRADIVERIAEQVKQHNRIRREITKSLKEGPKTVVAISEATEIPAPTVFWHLIAMKKYGLVSEAEQEADYPQYRLA
jgi:predicted transcriptional regulator